MNDMKDDCYCYSLDDEEYFDVYDFNNMVSELSDSGDLKVGAEYYVARKSPITTQDLIGVDAQRIIEAIEGRLYDLLGDSDDCGLEVSSDGKLALFQLMEEWLSRYVPSVLDCYRLVSPSQVKYFVEEDL